VQYVAAIIWAIYVVMSLWESLRVHAGEESFAEARSHWNSVRLGMTAEEVRRHGSRTSASG